MVGWVTHADTKTDRRAIRSGRIAHAVTEADGVARRRSLRVL
jgi:hypothetical protein